MSSGYEQAKWNTNAQSFPSEISIIHFHTFPWEHTVGFEGGAGNLNVPAVWKEVSDQQLSGCSLMWNSESQHVTFQVYSLSFQQGWVFLCIKNVFCLLTHPFLDLQSRENLLFYVADFKKSPPSAISFSSINKADSAHAAWIYVEWFEGLKSASAVLFELLVRCFPAVFCVAFKLLTKPLVLWKNNSLLDHITIKLLLLMLFSKNKLCWCLPMF